VRADETDNGLKSFTDGFPPVLQSCDPNDRVLFSKFSLPLIHNPRSGMATPTIDADARPERERLIHDQDVPDDPPPPYPSSSPSSTHRSAHGRRQRRRSHHLQVSSSSDHDRQEHGHHYQPREDEYANEMTPFLSANHGGSGRHDTHGHPRRTASMRSVGSRSSSNSGLQSMLSFLRGSADEDDDDYDDLHDDLPELTANAGAGRPFGYAALSQNGSRAGEEIDIFSAEWWRRYFNPMRRKAYYKALFHLGVLNFPFALVAWVYLFVFTVVCHRIGISI
jgi:hypothetical protein